MVSRITRLELPADDALQGFDTTIDHQHEDQDNTTFTMSSSLAAIAVGRSMRTSIATHALAQEQSVFGLQTSSSADTPTSNVHLTWKTSLAPHRVCQVASNASGNLIAATLDNGTISILRGIDGSVLATRRVAPEGTRLAATVEFVQQRGAAAASGGDTLIILPPEEGPPILVSNMQGDKLNDMDNPGVVAEAARSMGLHALKLSDCDDIRALRGVALNASDDGAKLAIIRLAVVDGDGQLGIYDYDLKEKTSVLVERSLQVDQDDNTSWEIDLEVGLRVHVVESAMFLVLSLYAGSRTKICWINLQDLKVSCEYLISPPLTSKIAGSSNKRARILALEPVQACSPDQALAIALGLRFPVDDKTDPHLETRLIQVVVKTDHVSEIATVENPHLVYTIPVPSSVQSMSVARTAQDSPYSFLCKTWSGDNYECHVFTTPMSSGVSVGSVRLLCAREEFQKAQDLLIQSQDDTLVQDPFASFHSSEITVKRLDRVLDAGSLSTPDAMLTSQSCLQQLVQGALSENSVAKRALLRVANRILHWPNTVALQNPPFLQEIVVVLEGMIAAMSRVASVFERGSSSVVFSTTTLALKERLQVIQQLQAILQEDGTAPNTARMSSAFENVLTFQDLFATLVKQGYFDAAEKLALSKRRVNLTAESMASSILDISSTVNPRTYSYLLTEIIFPSLSIGHELLPPLLAWSCKMADAYDNAHASIGNQNTLEDAIFLLETTERATKDLRLRLHSSFASYTPFVEMPPKRRKLDLSRSTMPADTSLASIVSVGSPEMEGNEIYLNQNEREWKRPNPTILEIGRLKGGAQKAQADGRLASVDAVDENEDTVELKLASARCLKYARTLGLDKHSVTLSNFFECGGARNIAKALVKRLSQASSSPEERRHSLCQVLLPFCETSGADYDEALFSYVRDLCGGKSTTKSKIEEAASVARCCSSIGTKCQVTLVTLRAALFCRFSPQWLSKLSIEAIAWASGDSSLRSELEEASRLLLIDGIVGRYCGEGAKELFHIDNPRHAIRLLKFVACQYDHEFALSDSLDLCDAFAHLSREDACSHILENAILKGESASAPGRLKALFEKNVLLAQSTFSKVIPFCIELVDEAASKSVSASENHRYKELVTCGLGLANVALCNIHSRTSTDKNGFSAAYYDEKALEELVVDLTRLSTLQSDHSVCLKMSSLVDSKALVNLIIKMLSPVMDAYLVREMSSTGAVVTRVRRACSVLSGCCGLRSSDLWNAAVGSCACRLALKSSDLECLMFMRELGVFEEAQDIVAARTCLSVSLSFCLKASKLAAGPAGVKGSMKQIAMALSVLQDRALLSCPLDIIDQTVSVCDLCDILTQIFSRADEGIGEELDLFRRSLSSKWMTPRTPPVEFGLVDRPSLHPTWYVGDGLLLSPAEILSNGLEYCKQSLQTPTDCEAALDLHSLVENRGAYGLGLRLLALTATRRMSSMENHPSYFAVQDAGKKSVGALAERYVGGTSNGFTSGVVDAQMAVSLLMCLPLKMAFSVYKSSLPTAISTRDFARVIILAKVGAATAKGTLFLGSGQPLQHWARQYKFVSQCQELALRANWWSILQATGVAFDTNRFQDSSQSSKEHTKASGKYIASLLPSFISKLSESCVDPKQVLEKAVNFAQAFGVSPDVPIRQHVVFLLSPPENDDSVFDKGDIRTKLGRLDVIVKSLLGQLDSPRDRALILRSCLRRLEDPSSSCDYERLSVVLSLYQAELGSVLMNESGTSVAKGIKIEVELVDRRRDALALLSWFYQGDLYSERPSFSQLFLPLPESWDADYSTETSRSILTNVLATERQDNETVLFDPLACFDAILSSPKGVSATSALAPLCFPLGIPRGFMHARSLIARFKKSAQTNAAPPSFEDDVFPTLGRLQLSSDIAELAEWCSLQYQYEDKNKLLCLDHALTFAMKASSESESLSARYSTKEFVSENSVSVALDRVKRLSLAKDMLSDRIIINSILKSANSGPDSNNGLRVMASALVGILDERLWSDMQELTPEQLVEIIIDEASLVASRASLDRNEAISVGQVREFSKLVERAVTAVSEKYSHLQVHVIARRLIRKWLFYGDGNTFTEENRVDVALLPTERADGSELVNIDEEDTMNFVLDLNSLQKANDFSTSTLRPENKLISEEEPNIFLKGSRRELSDLANHRTSLRVAFAMAFSGDDSSENDSTNNENQKPATNTKVKATRLRSKLSARGSKQRQDCVIDLCRELLEIVFARSIAGNGWILNDLNLSMDSTTLGGSSMKTPRQTITFAMRHRALRVASILCPQSALESVLGEDVLAKEGHSTLIKSTFAIFVAKEIEEMGLPLPHSDLAQLSSMHYPSYARTLWRHHRDTKHSKGRVLLLILEMYLMEEVSDHDFVLSILSEMGRLSLPRTLMIGFECINVYLERVGTENASIFLERSGTELAKLLKSLMSRIHTEVQDIANAVRSLETTQDDVKTSVTTTFLRFHPIIRGFSTIPAVQESLPSFLDSLLNASSFVDLADSSFDVLRVAESLSRHVLSQEIKNSLNDRITELKRPLLQYSHTLIDSGYVQEDATDPVFLESSSP